ncbi:Abi family protein [Brevibacillus sp. GCM10020057]
MTAQSYQISKPPATFEEQLQILKSRGLIVEDEDFAIRKLKKINYYRLSAYGLSLKRRGTYIPGTTFARIYNLYEFDRRFRYLILELAEQVEIAFRTHISYHIAHQYGAFGHLEAAHFDNVDYHQSFLYALTKEVQRSQEQFIRHHLDKYHGDIPIWVAVEVLSFGALSKLYSNMKLEDQTYIAKTNYRVPAVYLKSWLKCFAYVRNICAHYGRLYNRPLTSKPRLSREWKARGIPQDRIFAPICIAKQLIHDPQIWSDFLVRLEALFSAYHEDVELHRIGFPEDWEALLRKP